MNSPATHPAAALSAAPLPAEPPSAAPLPQEKYPAPAWLWPRRIPARALTLLAGGVGSGKSFLACDLAARISRGAPWPNSPG
ncbi:MAG: hypothetical protein EHM42_08555, partial [Planctomycetaceae bacterium]